MRFTSYLISNILNAESKVYSFHIPDRLDEEHLNSWSVTSDKLFTTNNPFSLMMSFFYDNHYIYINRQHCSSIVRIITAALKWHWLPHKLTIKTISHKIFLHFPLSKLIPGITISFHKLLIFAVCWNNFTFLYDLLLNLVHVLFTWIFQFCVIDSCHQPYNVISNQKKQSINFPNVDCLLDHILRHQLASSPFYQSHPPPLQNPPPSLLPMTPPSYPLPTPPPPTYPDMHLP